MGLFSYQQLLVDIQEEAGTEVPSNLPQLIRQTEAELWREFWFYGNEGYMVLTLPALSTELTLADADKVLFIAGIRDKLKDRQLKRLSMHQLQVMQFNGGKGKKELWAFAWDRKDKLYFLEAVDEDRELRLHLFSRDDWLIGEDDETSLKFFLNDGYALLKYRILYKHFFHPEKWAMWKRNFEEERYRLMVASTRKGYSYDTGTPFILED